MWQRSDEWQTFLQLPFGLAQSDMRTRYSGTVLGRVWFILNPLLQTALFTTFYTAFRGSFDPEYPLYVLTGFVLWDVVVSSVTTGCATFYYAEGYIKNFNFRVEQYLLRAPFFISFNFLAHGALVLLYSAIWRPESFAAILVTLFCLLPFIFLLSFSVSRFFAFLGVVFKDLSNFVPHVLQAIWFISPVFIWEGFFSDNYKFILEFNPVYYFLNLLREPAFENQFPSAMDFAVTCSCVFVFFIFGRVLQAKLATNIGLRL